MLAKMPEERGGAKEFLSGLIAIVRYRYQGKGIYIFLRINPNFR